ncbi:MAG: CARDB domain-containing protein [Methanobacteriota archaeon]
MTLTIVGLFITSGLMVIPSGVRAQQQGMPDLAVTHIGWRFPVMEGNELLGTIYVENQGASAVETGFWIELGYAERPGFWQQVVETQQIWMDPPIQAGEIKGVGFTTTGLATNTANFIATADSTDLIQEVDETNNVGYLCRIAVGVAPGSSVSIPIYVRNGNLQSADSFSIGMDETTVPSGWVVSGGIPPTSIDSPPGGNVVVAETIYVPEDALINPTLKLRAIRQSDGQITDIRIKIITTPEMGISFNPYLNDISVIGTDEIDSEVSVISEIILQTRAISVTKYTVTNNRGQYLSAIVEMVSTKNLNLIKIKEIDYNGILTIEPKNNLFLTVFKIDDGALTKYYQNMRYSQDMHIQTFYDSNTDTTTFSSSINGNQSTENLQGWQGVGVRILDGELVPIRLDTTEPMQPLCTNWMCWVWCIGLRLL